MLVDPKFNETEMEFWQRQNEYDESQLIENGDRKEELRLYCQSCCYRYPEECEFIKTLHPYDKSAETCPDFIPKDFYKAKSRAKCYLKRLKIDPNYSPLPDCELWHPIYGPFVVCDSSQYWRIVTKEKAYRFIEKLEQNRSGEPVKIERLDDKPSEKENPIQNWKTYHKKKN